MCAADHSSRNLLDDLNELIASVPMMSGETDKFTGPFEDRSAIDCTSTNRDTTPSSELNEPFVSQRSQCPQHGVVVDAQHGGEIACCWKSLSGFGLSIPDGTPNLRCDLLMERSSI